MSSLALVACVLALSAANVAAFYEGDSAVVTLTPDNWNLVEDSDHAWVVEFYAPWCGHCQKLAPTYAKFAEKMQSSVRVGAIDADAHPEFASKFGVQGYPSIKAFPGEKVRNPYTDELTKIPEDFTGAASLKGLTTFALSHQPNHVVSTAPSSLLPHASLPAMVLFTNKDTTSPMLKALSTEFKDRLVVVEVRSTDEASCAQAGVTSFPSIVLVKAGDTLDARLPYDGDLKFDAIAAWLADYVGERQPKAEEAHEPGQQHVVEVDAQVWGEWRNSDTPCVVAFTGDGKSPKGLGKLALNTNGGQANVGVVDCSQHKAVCKGVSAMPAVRVYGYGEDNKSDFTLVDPTPEGFAEAKTLVGESYPDTFVSPVNDAVVDQFLTLALQTPSKSAFLLFSDKERVPGLLKALSVVHQRRAVFGFAGQPTASLMERFGIKELPMLVSMFPNPQAGDDNAEVPKERKEVQFVTAMYNAKQLGGFNFRGVNIFAEQVMSILDKKADKTSGQQGEFQSGDQPTGPIPELTHANFGAECGDRTGLCAIALLDGDPKYEQAREAHLDLVSEVRRRRSPSPFRFAWMDGTCHAEFLMALDVSPMDLPTMVVLAPSKNRHARLIGKFDAAGLNSFTAGVLSGSIATHTIAAIPVPEDVDCTTVLREGDVVPESDDGMDEILAEILAEEQARKEALEEELRRELGDDDGKKKKKKKKGKKKGKQEL